MDSVTYQVGNTMLGLNQLPVAILITASIFGIFVCFVGFTMVYLRYYFNRYEPVYTMSEGGVCEKNHIASRFCKIILSNTITDQCLSDVENVGLWMLASNTILEWEDDSIVSVADLHAKLLAVLRGQLENPQYEKLVANCTRLELAVDSNLMKSKIATPPYLRGSTYAVWVTRVLSTLNKG